MVGEEYCLLKRRAMEDFLVNVLGPEGEGKVIGELGGRCTRLPERRRRSCQNADELELLVEDST